MALSESLMMEKATKLKGNRCFDLYQIRAVNYEMMTEVGKTVIECLQVGLQGLGCWLTKTEQYSLPVSLWV